MFSRTRRRLIAVVVQCTATAFAHSVVLPAQSNDHAGVQAVKRNPRALRATQRLVRRVPGACAQVRFEWDQVPGAHEYVLTGRWTVSPSWTMHTRQHRVSRRNATSWNGERVTFEVCLREGSHSWQVVAFFGATPGGDYATPALYSFDIR